MNTTAAQAGDVLWRRILSGFDGTEYRDVISLVCRVKSNGGSVYRIELGPEWKRVLLFNLRRLRPSATSR